MITGGVENIADCDSVVEAIDTLAVRTVGIGGAGSARCVEVSPAEMPEPFRTLLHHADYTADALERYYERRVELQVMQARGVQRGSYGRKAFLTLEARDVIVAYGLIHVRTWHLPDAVARRIGQDVHPVGHILTRYKVSSRVEPRWYVRLDRGSSYLRGFGTRLPQPVFGRVGTVYCEGHPAVEFLDIVTGVDPVQARSTPAADL